MARSLGDLSGVCGSAGLGVSGSGDKELPQISVVLARAGVLPTHGHPPVLSTYFVERISILSQGLQDSLYFIVLEFCALL